MGSHALWISYHKNIISHIKTSRGHPILWVMIFLSELALPSTYAVCCKCTVRSSLNSDCKMFLGQRQWHKLHKDIKAFLSYWLHAFWQKRNWHMGMIMEAECLKLRGGKLKSPQHRSPIVNLMEKWGDGTQKKICCLSPAMFYDFK